MWCCGIVMEVTVREIDEVVKMTRNIAMNIRTRSHVNTRLEYFCNVQFDHESSNVGPTSMYDFIRMFMYVYYYLCGNWNCIVHTGVADILNLLKNLEERKPFNASLASLS